MKRKAGILSVCGLAAAVVGVYVGCAIAQPASANDSKASVLGRTRIGFLNLNEVLKNYSKFKALRDELKAKDEHYVGMLKAKQTRSEALMNEAKDPKTTQQRKEQIEAELKQIKFDVDTIRSDAQKAIIKYQSEELAKLYREVYSVVTEYCTSQQIDVVFQYNEEWNTEYHSPQRVVQRMNLPVWPMHYDKSMELTGPVATSLNEKFARAPGAAPGGNVVPTSNKP